MNTITSPPTGERYEGAPAPGLPTPGSPTSGSLAGERSYRYPGSPPFRDNEIDRRLFKGREEEAKKVFHSILSADLFLLYAVSGMGKSSLLNAGVMHRLRARGYWPVNVRLNDTTLSPVQSIDRQIAQADIRDTDVEVQRTPGLDFDITADTTLWDLLGSLEVWRGDRLQQLVVVLDQFEELFTLDWQADVRNRFISEFGQVVRGHRSVDGEALAETSAVPVPNVKFCIVIREDALGQLEALADDVPQIMQNRFRLGALDATQAELAIREPAMVDDGMLDTPRFEYSEAAARQILDFLQETERAAILHLTEVDTDTSVDPSQLQIICQYIERRVLPAKGIPPEGQVVTITTDDLGGAEGLRSVLGDFYRRTVATFPPSTQRAVQRLCEEGLISKSGRRLSIERDEIGEQYAVQGAILDELVDQRLLRVEPRVGSTYYELSHDTLVRPILADRSERRKAASRRHRRFAFIAAGVVAVLVLGFVAYRLGFGEGKDSVASIEFGTSLQREVESPGAVELFQVVAREQPSLVLVEPSEDGTLDAALTITNSNKARRDADQLRQGEAERIVVPAGPGDRLNVAVSSKDASIGAFEITHGELAVNELVVADSGSETASGSIDEPGGLAVYSLDVGDGTGGNGSESSVEIFVTTPAAPTTKKGEKPDPALDVEIEIIDPAGASTITDLQAAGNGERATIDGPAGRYLVLVRDHGAGTGQFEITATDVDFTTLSLDEAVRGEVESPDVPVAYAVDVRAGTNVEVTVTPASDFDVLVELIDPTGTGSTTDSAGIGGVERMTLSGDPGRYLVGLRSYDTSTGEFEITASDVTYTPLSLDRAVEGEVASANVPAVFSVDVTAESDVGVVVTPTDDVDLTLDIVDPSGTNTFADSGGSGGAELAHLTGAGQHLVRVGGYEGAIGSFEILAAPVDPAEMVEGVPISATAPAVFVVDVASGELLNFVAESADPEGVLSIRVIDSEGFETGIGRGSLDAGEPATAILDGALPGSYEIIVGAVDPDTDITATIQPVTSQLLLEDDAVTTAAPASFDVDVAEGRALTFTATPENPDSVLDITVLDVDGNATGATSTSPSDGEPATVSIGGGVAGRYRIFVNYSGAPTDVTATLQAGQSEQLTLGSAPVTGVAPTSFDIDVPADARGLVIVTPQGDDTLTVTITSPGSEFTSFVESSGPGEPLVALLTGAGTHHVVVDTFGEDDGSFTIETTDMGAPGGP